MRDWLSGGNKEEIVRAGVEQVCKERYKDAKFRFKRDYFTERGGYEDPDGLRDDPPPEVPPHLWNQFIDHVTSVAHKSRAEKNSENRSQQKFASRHGSQSYVSRRENRRLENPTHQYPSLIDNWKEMHTDKNNGVWNSQDAHDLHESMLRLKARSSENTSEEEILEEVLGTRRGHNRGRGRKLPMASTSSLPTSSRGPRMYTDDDVVKTRVQEELTRYLQAIQAANPSFVIPKYPNVDDDQDEEEEDGEGEEDDD